MEYWFVDWTCDLMTPEEEKKARFEALMEAKEAWQLGQWANAPRSRDPIQERIANAQFVTDWLKARAEMELE